MRQIQFYISQEMYEQVKKLADFENATIAEIIRLSLKKMLINGIDKKKGLAEIATKYSRLCTDYEDQPTFSEIYD